MVYKEAVYYIFLSHACRETGVAVYFYCYFQNRQSATSKKEPKQQQLHNPVFYTGVGFSGNSSISLFTIARPSMNREKIRMSALFRIFLKKVAPKTIVYDRDVYQLLN
jgi:hypothetical protein